MKRIKHLENAGYTITPLTMSKQDQNIHTIEQIKSMGNKILTTKGEIGLTTVRGNTVTVWAEVGQDEYTPVNAYVRD